MAYAEVSFFTNKTRVATLQLNFRHSMLVTIFLLAEAYLIKFVALLLLVGWGRGCRALNRRNNDYWNNDYFKDSILGPHLSRWGKNRAF